MPVEFIGLIRTKPASELNSGAGSLGDDIIDPAYVREFAKAHEEGGFDKVQRYVLPYHLVVPFASASPCDQFLVLQNNKLGRKHIAF